MKKRKWQKAAALIACVTMVATTPNITNVVNGSAYDDGNVADFISAEDSGADNSWNGTEDFSQNENEQMTEDSVDFISGFSSEDDFSLEEGGFEENGEAGAGETQEVQDGEEEKAWVTLESAGETRQTAEEENTEYQWIHISSQVSQGEAAAKVRLYLKEHETEMPAKVLKAALVAKLPENLSEASVTDWMKVNTPVVLENARVDGEKLPVTYVQEYLRDENGEYVTDENGNLTVTSQYLEYELPAQGNAEFYVALAYSTAETEYHYQADMIPQVTAEVNGERKDILEKSDDSKFSITWKPEENKDEAPQDPTEDENQKDGEDANTPAEENPENGQDSETPAKDEKQEDGNGDQAPAADTPSSDNNGSSTEETKEALVRISLTKELEDVCSDVEASDESSSKESSSEDAVQEETEDGIEMVPETDASEEDSTQTDETQEAKEETAVSGQTYAVHVTAQDLHEDSTGDITVKLHLKDSETGLPLQGISTSFGKTKEEALAGEATNLMEIPAGLPDQDLTVSRVQESTTDENGDTQITADYITFQLPAGSTADFYVGITYTAQEEEYSQTLAMEAEAQQLVVEKAQSAQDEPAAQPEEEPQPTEAQTDGVAESQPETEAQPETDSEAEPQTEIQADFQSETQPEESLFSLPGALETQVGESLDETEEIPTVEETGETESAISATDSEGTTDDADSADEADEGEKKLVNVLDGTAVVTLAWAARAAGGTRTLQAGDWLYFDVSNSRANANSDLWDDAGAIILLCYGNGKSAEMIPCEQQDYLYKIKLTQEMVGSSWFKFKRTLPNSSYEQWMPASTSAGDNNLQFDKNQDSNYFEANGYTTGNWVEDKWLTFNHAGKTLYFLNMKGDTVLDINAEFSVTGKTDNSSDTMIKSDVPNLYSVTIPNGADYDTVTFTFENSDGDTIFETTKILEGNYDPDTNNTFYYAASEIGSDVYGTWGTYPKKEKIAGKKLYLDNTAFPTNTSTPVTIQIGDESAEELKVDTEESNMYLYSVPEDSEATQQTIITLKIDSKVYRLLWGNIKKNKVTITKSIANVTDKYRKGYTVYYDATLSRLSYENSEGAKNSGQGIPYNDSSSVYCYVVKDDGNTETRTMSPVPDSNGNLWSVDLTPKNGVEYTKIRFAGYEVKDDKAAANGDATDLVEIPWDLDVPCYYGDDSDDAIYNGGNRGGYWDEKGNVRDAESGKNQTVVDVPTGTFTRSENTLYVDTTLYDYYSDYELNGSNRDNYNTVDIAKHRIYQPFRQLNQALSEYYTKNNVTYPLYWGNFQNYTSSKYTEIADTLNLFGYDNDNYKQFFYENNSMWDINGVEIKQGGKNATQGLAGSTLSGGNLTLSGGKTAPFFDESFLSGDNSKNTVLGKVYHNVTFPFVKKALSSSAQPSAAGTVDYWYFNSADQDTKNKNLQLQYDATNGYFLQSTDNVVKGQTVESGHPATKDGNYFPFNTSSQSGNACQLNYGFGQKIEFKFRLTENGTVTTTEKVEVPIEFNFSGDDDVWVYIDGNLVLDVGGGHGAVDGRINFRDKTAWVSKVKNSSGGGYTDNKTTDFPAVLKNDADFYHKEHTLTMFYMERGLWESNMKITFNMPDNNQLEVEKEVDTSNVDSQFKFVFDDIDFPMNIQNLATSGKVTQADTTRSDSVKPVSFTGTASPASSSNTFESSSVNGAEYHWKALFNNTGQKYTDKRLGVITNGSTVNVSEVKDYLEFELYFPDDTTPKLSATYIQLKDNSGNTLSGFLSGKVMSASNLAVGTWNTVKVNLSKLTASGEFDYTQVKSIAFQYDQTRDIYLKGFTFSKENTSVGKLTGFTVQQDNIPDYGSINSKKLENAYGARYAKYAKDNSSTNGMVDQNGMFTLQDGQSVTFNDQFRRGSYIYLEEYRDSDLFDTSWTLYENGKEVTLMADGDTVKNTDGQQVVNQTGTVVNDGRTEKKASVSKPEKNTLVFRSYTYPDSETTLIKLKAKYVNKVKVGGLTIKKSQGKGSNALEGSYSFTIKFEDIAGMGKSIKDTFTLKAGESKTFTGIPVGTRYTITETTPEDGSTLEDIKLSAGNDEVSSSVADHTVTGVITADTQKSEYTVADFVNTKIPKTAIHVEKIWENADKSSYEGTLPASIKVKLQRFNEEKQLWEDVEDVEIKELTAQEDWKCNFSGLTRYTDTTNSTEYQYRVVELDEKGNVLEQGGIFGRFQASYKETTSESGDNKSVDLKITNTYMPLTAIKVIKIDAANRKPLPGVDFKLEKINSRGNSPAADELDSTFTAVTETTDSNGELTFKDLENGLYRLTETKAAENHSLLKAPVYITINRAAKSEIDGTECTVTDDTITITIANSPKFELPATGSWSRLILGFGGGILIGMAVIIYLLQKRRKGVKTS